MKKLICLLLSIMVLSVVGCDRQEKTLKSNAGGAVQNKPAPDITVKSMDGKDIKLSDYKGKVVMLNFWATWCPPCREEIPSMMNLQKQMEGKPFQMLAVSVDEGGKADVDAFFKKTGFMLPVYTDQNKTAATAYGVTGVPETYIVDTKGIIVKKVIGPLKWDDAEVVAYITKLIK
jgi:cytochrome c biogenesis protein CcmG, thiol:disulfide interchange protein DsbE